MKTVIVIASLLISLVGHCQAEKDSVFIRTNATPFDSTITYQTDTILFDTPMARHVLVGTAVLTASPKNEGARNFGYGLFGLESSACQRELEGPKREGSDLVVSVARTDTLWVIEANISSNCCHSFLGEIEIVEGSVMNLIYHGYGTYCSCDCCFGLTYRILREKFVEPEDVKEFMINGDKRTLRRIN